MTNLRSTLEVSITMEALTDRAEAFCRAFADAPVAKRFVLGRGDYAASVAAAIPIGGFVDDFATDVTFAGLPVLRSADLPAGAFVVVASMLRIHTALASLDDLPVSTLDYYAFQRFCGLDVDPITFWEEFRRDYRTSRSKYDAVRDRLGDDRSREVFDRLVRFRLTNDVSAMEGFVYDIENQYFEDFLELRAEGESFVDVGSFDGQTSLEFARRAPQFEHITAFEPGPDNAQRVRDTLTPLGLDRVTIHECGLSDRPGTLSFASGQGSSSRVSDEGDITIRVERLDDLDLRVATMIKIDIEGGEEAALLGAIETIRSLRPRLAISVYHRADDFWRIPEIVDRSGVEYRLELRHYTEGIDETVMFFLPLSPDA